MRYILILYASLFIFSCGKDKMVQLPEINHSEISEINDVSAAYLFYNETEVDSIELNRKNLISTTNWLVNVDKRLTLKQVIPKIKFLQEKKQKSEHKNENAKNYFTCNDISKKDLGFIEFTNVVYKIYPFDEKPPDSLYINISINFKSLESITIISSDGFCGNLLTFNWKDFSNKFNDFGFDKSTNPIDIIFDENLLFQDYITFKVFLEKMKRNNISISNEEIISN
ncbi:hypothetical protein VP395_11140 [Mariniflexile soesokkakense]|uniref:Lipoprotein n=1 Tax=Mariniflexile soesokkakense TaxID=1343160 RepID=A0ABV0ABN8_9FLAO